MKGKKLFLEVTSHQFLLFSAVKEMDVTSVMTHLRDGNLEIYQTFSSLALKWGIQKVSSESLPICQELKMIIMRLEMERWDTRKGL